MKHIIKIESFDNLSIVRPLIAMKTGTTGEPEFSIKDPRTIITGTWNPSLTDNTKEVLIRGEVTLNGKADCYSLMFEDENSHLTINAGARLRIWEGGIVNDDCTTVNYLTIVEDAVNDSYGEFLLHPDVTVNNHPLASVELISNSYWNSSSNYLWGRLSIPFQSINSIICKPIGETIIYEEIQRYNYTQGKWESLGYIGGKYSIDPTKLDLNFTVNNIIDYVNSTSEHPICEITGKIIGNTNVTLENYRTYTNFGNSFLGRIKTEKLLEIFNSNIELYVSTILINKNNVDDYKYITQITNPFANAGNDAIMLKNVLQHSITITLNYKDLVWDPSFEEEVTPTRCLMKCALTTAKPSEVDTTLEGSGIFANPEPIFPPEHDDER